MIPIADFGLRIADLWFRVLASRSLFAFNRQRGTGNNFVLLVFALNAQRATGNEQHYFPAFIAP
jgi:hypothetical protein